MHSLWNNQLWQVLCGSLNAHMPLDHSEAQMVTALHRQGRC